jgi:translocation and assembly module TamB
MNWKKTIKRIAAGVAYLSLSAFLCAILLFGVLQTDPGKEYLVRVLQRFLTEEGISIGKLTGFIPFHFQVDHFALADRHGEWLVIRRIQVQWSALRLLRGDFHFARLGAETTEMIRLPEGTAAKPTESKTGGLWPPLLQRLGLEHFFINRLTLRKAILGKQAAFAVEASMTGSSPGGILETSISIRQVEGGNATFTTDATWSPHKEDLLIRARIEEPAGGVFAEAIGFEGPLLFSLEGEGTRNKWEGSLKGRGGPFGALDSKIHLLRAKETELIFSGSFKVNRACLPDALAAWVSEEASLTFVARPEDTETVSLEQLSLKTGSIALEIRGKLDLAANRSKMDFSLVSQDLSPMRVFLDSVPSGKLTARGTLSGSPRWPRAVLDIRLENPASSGVKASGLESRWDVNPLERGDTFPSRFHITGDGRIRDLAIEKRPWVFPKSIAWSGEAEVSSGKPLLVGRLQLDSERISGALAGEIDLQRLKSALDVSLEMDDSALLADWLEYPLPFLGKTSVRGSLRIDPEETILAGSLQGKSRIIDEALPSSVPLPGKEVTYTTGFSIDREIKIILSGAQLKSAGTTLQGELALDTRRKMIQSTWELHLTDPAFLTSSLKRPLEGSIHLKGFMDGPFSKINTRLELTGENLRVDGEDFQKAFAELHFSGLPPNLSGSLSLELTWHQQPYFSEAHFNLEGSRLNFHRFSLEGSGMTLDGSLNMNLHPWFIEGDLQGKSPELSALSSMLGRTLSGSIEINSKFQIGDDRREVLLDVSGKDLGGFGGQIHSAEWHARLRGKDNAPSGTTSLKLAGLRLGDLRLSGLEVATESDGRRIAYSARIKGHYKQTLEIMTSGEVLPFSERQEIAIHRLQGSFGEMPIILIHPAILVRSQGSVTLDKFLCSLGTGRFEAGGSFKTGELRVNSRFEKLPLSAASIFWPSSLKGTASGKLALQGPPHELAGELEMQVEEVEVPQQIAPELPSASLELTAVLENHLLRSRLSVKGLTQEPFRGSLELPLDLSVTPFRLSFPPSGRLKGTLDGSMDLARLTSFLALHDQMMKGTATIALALEGTAQEPSLSGRIYAAKGAYENYRTGTIITEAEIEIEASNRDLRIKHAHMRDGEAGSITAEGWMSLDSSQAFPFRMDFTVNHSKIVRLDEATATVNGPGVFEGSLKRVTLSGQFTIESAEIQIPKRLPTKLTEVDVIEIHGKEVTVQPDRTVVENSAEKGGNLWLDFSLKIPGRAVVRGRGLESEWQGDLRVQGTTDRPELTGKLSLLRGGFDLFSKRFDLTRGFISFSGSAPPQPLLDVTGEVQAKDLLARVQIIGPIQSLEIKLTSEPPYPADEILAHLLFGRSLNQITPIQAFQLASALNTLRGSEGFDLLGRTRRLLGVDELTLGETKEKEEKPSVKVGKYVSETVYIKVESGISPETGKASVEWQVTPNITVETEVGVNASAGVGVNWRWDY